MTYAVWGMHIFIRTTILGCTLDLYVKNILLTSVITGVFLYMMINNLKSSFMVLLKAM